MAPTPSYPPNISPLGQHVLVAVIATIVPATIFVALRFYARVKGRVGIKEDDWMILVALGVIWTMCSLRIYLVKDCGLGYHRWELPAETSIRYQKAFLAVQQTYFLAATTTKLSILLFYRRIFGVKQRFTTVLYCVMALVVCYLITCIFLSIFGCHPVSYFWDKQQAGYCFNETQFFRWNGIASVLLDVITLVLPLPMIWRLQLSLRQKIELTGIFSLGAFVCAASAFRLIQFQHSNQVDPTYTGAGSNEWSSIEQSLGVLCACLPTLRPLFRSRPSGSSAGSSGRQRRSAYLQAAYATGGSKSNETSGSKGKRDMDSESVIELTDALSKAPQATSGVSAGDADSSEDVNAVLQTPAPPATGILQTREVHMQSLPSTHGEFGRWGFRG